MTREDLRRQGEAMRDQLQGASPDLPGGFGTLLTEAVFGGIWSRPGLALSDRIVCALTAVAVFPRLQAVQRLVGAALDHGIAPATIREVLVQAGLYAGFTATEETLPVAARVFAARGVALPPDPPADVSLEELTARGRTLMHELHGERAQSGYAAPDNPTTGALYPLAIQYRLWRDLVPARSRPARPCTGRGGGVHRPAPAGASSEVRPIGFEHGAHAD